MDLLALIQAHPKISIILIGIAVSLFITLVNYFVLDKEKMRNIKEKQKIIQEQMKQHKENPSKLMELQREMMSHAMESMKHSLKPMLITLLPMVLFFGLIRSWYASTEIANIWILYYLGGSVIGSLLFRKIFDLP